MTRALDPEVFEAIWATVQPLLPVPDRSHPLGTHRPRADDRLCMRGIVIRLVTGSSWVDIEAILDWQVSDTTLRARRDEWIRAGVFDLLETEARAGYDRILGLDLSEVAIDGSLHKAPCGGEGTGKNPTDRAKLGWKWSVAVDAAGIPIGWATSGANCNDIKLVEPTLDAIAATGLDLDIDTMHLDRGYDFPAVHARIRGYGFDDLNIQRRKPRGVDQPKQPMRLGLRWVVEATNSWWSNYGQLRRSTDRKIAHRLAAISLASTVLMTSRLLDYRDRWSPTTTPIR
jgi:transposase